MRIMNIQIRYWMLLLCSCCLILGACSEDTPEQGAAQQMALSENAVMFIQHAASKEVTVTNGGDWNVTVPEDASGWCSAVRADDVLVITVTENTATDLRETVLTVGNGQEQKTLPVRQTGTNPVITFMTYDLGDGANYSFDTENLTLTLDYDQTGLKVEVVSNVPFETVSSDSWIQVVSQSERDADGHAVIELSMDMNPDINSDRGTEIVFSQAGGDYMVLLPVVQRKCLGFPFELTDEMFTVTPKEGAIDVAWTFPEGTIYHKVVFEYTAGGGTLTKEVLRTEGTQTTIDNLLNRYGEITFNVKVLNEDGHSLVANAGGFSFEAQCEAVQSKTEEIKIDLSAKADDLSDEDGLKWLEFSGISEEGNLKYENLVDGKYESGEETVFQTDNRWQTTRTSNWIIVQIPDDIACTSFTIKTINALDQISQAPGIYKIYIGDEGNVDSNDWEEVFSQDTKEWKYWSSPYPASQAGEIEYNGWSTCPSGTEGNAYRHKTLKAMSSKTLGKEIKYIKYEVTDRNNSANRNDYFKLAEFEVYNIVITDPENETDTTEN